MNFKRGQVTIFVIIAILLVGSVILFFVFKNSIFKPKSPSSEVDAIYNNFISCLEERTLLGAGILGNQGGYIYLPDFEPGSTYMPFSSQLNFLGTSIPYWYYVSGNNIKRTQVPTQRQMEQQLERFIVDGVMQCSFEENIEQGFEILRENPRAQVIINDDFIRVSLKMDMNIYKGDSSYLLKEFNLETRTNLGRLYKSALRVYEKQQKDLFLENYAIDILRLNAPVDGVELQCDPLIWNADEVFSELQEAIQANTHALKNKGSDFRLVDQDNKYFVLDLGVSENVRFLNSRNWSYSFEVNPTKGNIMMNTPVGNQPGLGILGFCYVPYHYVYSLRYPVLVQVSKDNELFQFPLAVVVDRNKPREAGDVNFMQGVSSGICENKNNLVSVRVYDKRTNLIPANISYECFGEVCDISGSGSGEIRELFPQCVNGNLIVNSKGYRELKQTYTSMNPDRVDVFLDKLYPIKVRLNLGGASYNGNAIISFLSDDGHSQIIFYPQQDVVELSEGQYEVFVSVYQNSSIKLEGITYEQCTEVPSSLIGGLFGMTKKKCFDMSVPPQIVSNVLIGGGNQNHYILESELSKGSYIEIFSDRLKTPRTIEELQENYILFEESKLMVVIR